ncbi:MAG: plastocyanin/azurin family copper-binding protein [Dehalococcoidia bacterium]
MSSLRVSRRKVLLAGGLLLTGLGAGVPPAEAGSAAIADVALRSSQDGARVWFDPVGIVVAPGTTVRWTLSDGVHTATAYHPDNDGYALRIPKDAKPWDSGYLTEPGASYSVRLDVEGVYDYFCRPHELGGMAGRIVVGRPAGPGYMPFDYWRRAGNPPPWKPVSSMARTTIPDVDVILREGVVRANI